LSEVSLLGLFIGLFNDTLPIEEVTENQMRSGRMIVNGKELVVAYFEIFPWNLLKRLKRKTKNLSG
jgi:hypothetical protein